METPPDTKDIDIRACTGFAASLRSVEENFIQIASENFKKLLVVFVEYLFEVERKTHGVST
jgi:hypothetical protein